jgi:hypothetical protein
MRYPDGIQDEERAAWRSHLRDRWANWAGVLSRIKGDEHKWLSVAFLLYGAIAAFVSSDPGGFFSALYWHRWAALAVTLVVIHGTAFAWAYQTLTLRVQYYRSMCRLLMVQEALGEAPPEDWVGAEFTTWREKATAPRDSKFVEMVLLGGLVCVVGLLTALRFAAGSTGVADGLAAVGATIISAAALPAWPFLIYLRLDSWLLRRRLYENPLSPMATLRRTSDGNGKSLEASL